MITKESLETVLARHFADSFPEEGEDYAQLLSDLKAVKVSLETEFDRIIDLHFADAYLQDNREIRNLKLPLGSRHTIDSILAAPKIIRIVRKCLEHHFGIEWMLYRSKSLNPPLSKLIRAASGYTLQFVRPVVSAQPVPGELFKYTTASTAISILKAGKLRLNSPLNFNDIKDIQVDPNLPQNEEELIKLLQTRREEVIFNEEPIPGDKSNVTYMLNSMVRGIRAPTTTREKFRSRHQESDSKVAATIKINHENIVKFWKHFVQYFRVLCLSDIKNDPRMWGTYSERHSGIMFVFNPLRFDEPLTRWSKVEYLPEPPKPIDPISIINDILGIQKLDKMEKVSRLCFAKHTSWSPESEWRCVLLRSDWEHHPLENVEQKMLFDDINFPLAALTEVYIGVNCSPDNRQQLLELIKNHYPSVKIFTEIANQSSFESRFDLVA